MKYLAAIAALLAAIALPGAVAAQSEFPVTIPHAFGETVIEAPPERVVTWGWATQDAVIALGLAPVAIPYFDYGGDAEGMLEWTRAGLAELGAEMPMILDNSGDGPPVEQIAAADPDLILAVYSGLTADQYAVLSQIAPVVAYPDQPWATPWRDVITITGTALGKATEAEALVADLDAWLADQVAQYPQVAGTSFAGISVYNDMVSVYAALDPRMAFLEDLGMVLAPSVDELAPTDSTFYYTLSYETVDRLRTDILISYFATEAEADAFYAQPVIANLPQVRQGAVASLVGPEYINSVSPPSALSLRWGFPHYLELIAAAAERAAP